MSQQVLYASAPPVSTHSADRRPRWVLLGIWWVMTLMGVLMLAGTGRNMPVGPDWSVVEPLAGPAQSALAWVQAAPGGQAAPVSRAALLGLLDNAGGDFRAVGLVNITLLSVLAFALMRATQEARGRAEYLDAIFPVALLHPGHIQSVVWASQLLQVLPMVLAGGLLAALLLFPRLNRSGSASLAGGGVLVLSWAGGLGPFVALALSLGFLGVAIGRIRQGRSGRGPLWPARLLAVASLGAVTGVVWQLKQAGPIDLARPLDRMARLAASAPGPAGTAAGWPMALAMAVVAAVALIVSVRKAFRAGGDEARRYRAVALLLAGLGLAVVATGLGFVPLVDPGLANVAPSPFVEFSALGWCAGYLALGGLDTGRPNRAAQAMFWATVAILPFNTVEAFRWRAWFRDGTASVERALVLQTSAATLALGHQDFLGREWSVDDLAQRMGWLGGFGGPFARLPADDTELVPPSEMPWDARHVVKRQIRLRSVGAGKVFLLWGLDGWKVLPLQYRPEGTTIERRIMRTPMAAAPDGFLLTLDVPGATPLEYRFHITENREQTAMSPVLLGDYSVHATAVPSESVVIDAPAEIEAQLHPGPAANFVSVEFHYLAPKMDQVALMLRLQTADTFPPGLLPEIGPNGLPMGRDGAAFVASIKVPPGTEVDYGFRVGEGGRTPQVFFDTNSAYRATIWENSAIHRRGRTGGLDRPLWRWPIGLLGLGLAALVVVSAVTEWNQNLRPFEDGMEDYVVVDPQHLVE